jgi:hypothetical protein
MKKLDQIPEVAIPCIAARRKALSFASRALVGQFMGLWPSPCDRSISGLSGTGILWFKDA